MYFILSKILLYLLLPLSWIFVLFVLCITTKSKKRRARYFIASLSLLYIFSNNFLFNQVANRWDIAERHLNSADKYSCAIILGGFSSEGPNGEGMFNMSADRFIQGAMLFKTGKVSRILITGGNGSLLPGQFMVAGWKSMHPEKQFEKYLDLYQHIEEKNYIERVRKQFLALQIPDTAILIENKSRNTIENARFTKVVLNKARQQGPFLLVTSAFHMRRAEMIFKKEHIEVVPYPSNFITNRTGRFSFDDYFIPDSEILGRWNVYLKEFVGYIVNSFNG